MKVNYKNLKVSMKVEGVETTVSIEEAEVELNTFEIKDMLKSLKDLTKMCLKAQVKNNQKPEEE